MGGCELSWAKTMAGMVLTLVAFAAKLWRCSVCKLCLLEIRSLHHGPAFVYAFTSLPSTASSGLIQPSSPLTSQDCDK